MPSPWLPAAVPKLVRVPSNQGDDTMNVLEAHTAAHKGQGAAASGRHSVGINAGQSGTHTEPKSPGLDRHI